MATTQFCLVVIGAFTTTMLPLCSYEFEIKFEVCRDETAKWGKGLATQDLIIGVATMAARFGTNAATRWSEHFAIRMGKVSLKATAATRNLE